MKEKNQKKILKSRVKILIKNIKNKNYNQKKIQKIQKG